MITFVALLRGINVGKAKPVAMADLREIVESLGHRDVTTLLRSGNVVFRAADDDPARVASALETAIEGRLGIDVRVVVRTADELATIVAANPLAEAEGDGPGLHVMVLDRPLGDEETARLADADFGPDDVRPAGREIYVWYRRGMSGSKTAETLARRLIATATDRNWNTVKKLLALALAAADSPSR
jgi:uncharacterized protein (DUF1697 family)